MRVPSKLLIFTFWVFSLTFAQGQDCLPSDIKEENTEALEKTSYANGEIVKVTCSSGYTGMYKFTCINGQWKKTLDRKCTKKKCGHPGDVPNSDFRLLGGNTEFVFGVTVEYTCKKGYIMQSRINQRTCRNNGWDNAVPSCEIMKCPPIYTEEDVTAMGNTEEGSYGDVVQFDCKSPENKIDGKSDIHCKEDGTWSDAVPKCIPISCKQPEIQYGTIRPSKPEYRKDETLQYECDNGFKKREGTPKCVKHGWTLEPECEEITCEIKETKFGILKITPEGKNFFKVGETLSITCSERYRIFFTKETVKSFKCLPDGRWDNQPICEEITCEIPRERGLYYASYYFYGNLRLDERREYKCLSGYRKTATEAECTKDGWKPDPLCSDYTCEAPNLPNAQIVYPEYTRTQYAVNSVIEYICRTEPQRRIQITCNYQGKWTNIQPCTEEKKSCTTPIVTNGFVQRDSKEEKIYYSCDPGYKPYLSKNWWGTAVCENEMWINEPRCIREDSCGVLPKIENGQLTLKQSTVEIQCETGFKPSDTEITCVNGTWRIPEPACESDKKSCDSPPKVDNALITSEPQAFYSSRSFVNYQCRTNFTMSGKSKVVCNNAEWDEAPTCEAFCPKPLQIVNNATLGQTQERKYSHGDTVRYECVDDYESKEETIAKCDVQTWIYPECIKKAECLKPTKNLRFVTLLDEKTKFNNFEILRYQCIKPYDKIPEGSLICNGGKWNDSFVCTSSINCPPPPMIEDGDYSDEHQIDGVITEVAYSCQSFFVPNKQKRFYRCLNGKWETPPKCLKPCEITPEIKREYNIRPQYDYIAYNTEEKVDCNEGWNVGGTWRLSYTTALCNNGKLTMGKKCLSSNWTK